VACRANQYSVTSALPAATSITSSSGQRPQFGSRVSMSAIQHVGLVIGPGGLPVSMTPECRLADFKPPKFVSRVAFKVNFR